MNSQADAPTANLQGLTWEHGGCWRLRTTAVEPTAHWNVKCLVAEGWGHVLCKLFFFLAYPWFSARVWFFIILLVVNYHLINSFSA